MAAPGTRIHGCSYQVAGRCLIIRVDDPGVVRHELAPATAGSIRNAAAARRAPDPVAKTNYQVTTAWMWPAHDERSTTILRRAFYIVE
jgi:hypothetical protein